MKKTKVSGYVTLSLFLFHAFCGFTLYAQDRNFRIFSRSAIEVRTNVCNSGTDSLTTVDTLPLPRLVVEKAGHSMKFYATPDLDSVLLSIEVTHLDTTASGSLVYNGTFEVDIVLINLEYSYGYVIFRDNWIDGNNVQRRMWYFNSNPLKKD